MKLNKFSVILAILLISIMAIGAVSAESVDDSSAIAIDDNAGDVQESIEPADVAEDLSTADTVDDAIATDTADEIVNEESGAVLGDEPKSYDLDDGTYSKYFKEDGTATDLINESNDYTLNVGTLNNKDIKINYGSHINIVGKEGAGFINNGTIYLDGGADGNVGSVTISGLTFANTNKNCIDIAQYCTDINIKGNIINLIGDASLSPDNPYLTVTAIAPHDFVYGLNIIDNKVTVTGDAPYSNGIYVMNYLSAASPSNFNISGNTFDLNVSTYNGSAAAIFVECSDSVIENNNISIVTAEDLTYAYGIQIPDMASNNYYDKTYEGTATSFNNVAIKNNKIDIITKYMAYGISLYNYGTNGFDEDWADYGMYYPNFSAFELNVLISDNEVYIKSDKGVYGIVAQIYNMTVENNNLTIIGGSAEGIDSPDLLGEGTIAIDIQYNCANPYEDFYVDVKDNIIYTNVTAENTNDVEGYVTFDNDKYTIQDDDGAFIVTEDTYNVFFDENGNLKDIIPAGSTVLLGELNNKKLIINTPLTIKAFNDFDILTNTVINLVAGADGTVIDGLTFELYGDENTGSTALVYAKEVNVIEIKNNEFNVYNFVDKTGAKYGSSVYPIEIESGAAGCHNVLISENVISVTGSARYLYGIDVFQTWGSENKNDEIVIFGNNITIDGGSRMAEPIYVSGSSHVLIASNDVKSYSFIGGTAYGIGTDSLEYATISNNKISADSKTMAYGITSTYSKELTFSDNNIYAKGAGAIGIGLMNDTNGTINRNTITIDGGDYKNAPTGDAIGTDNKAILVKSDCENITVSMENDITENVPKFIDNDNYATYFNEDGTIKEGTDMGDYIVLDKLTNKTIVVDRPLAIEGTAVDTQIKVISGAEGTTLFSLDMEATTTSGNFAFISVTGAENINIIGNNLVIACNNDLSTYDSIMPIEINAGATGCNAISIEGNNIVVTGQAPYVYGIDVYSWTDGVYNDHISIVENNITIDINGAMSEAIYLSRINNSMIFYNKINSASTDAAYGIASDNVYETNINHNTVTVKAGGMGYGITATTAGKNVEIGGNTIDVTGTGAMGIGISNQDSAVINNNDVSIDGGDYTTTTSWDQLGVGNAAIFEGQGNTNTKLSNNRVEEYTSIKLEATDLTVTAAPSGQGSFEVAVKTLDGKALANKELTISFNNQVIKATTDANGIAKLSFDLNKAGKYPVSVAFLGDKNYRGAFATATITINPIKTTLTSAAKTYLATAKTKSLTATLKDANGNALANKKVTFTVNGKTVTATTNAKGVATAKLALTAAKTYTVSIKFAGDDVYAASTVSAKVKLNKEKTKVTAPKKTFKKSKKVKKVVVTLKNSKGKAIAKKKVTLTVNKKKYTAKTNKKGKATFKIKNLKKKGTKKYTVKFAGDTQYKACKKTGKIKIK